MLVLLLFLVLLLISKLILILLNNHNLLSNRLPHDVEVAIILKHVLVDLLEEVGVRSESEALLLFLLGRLFYLLDTRRRLLSLLRNRIVTLLQLLVIGRLDDLDVVELLLELVKHDLQLSLLFFEVLPIEVELLLALPRHLLVKAADGGRRIRYQDPLVIDRCLYAAILWVEFLLLVSGSQWMRSLTSRDHGEVRIHLRLLFLVRVDQVGRKAQELLLGFILTPVVPLVKEGSSFVVVT